MTILGDIERAFATLVFPNLLLFTVLAVIVLVLLVVLARRRGWDRIVRRHPVASRVAVIALLVVGLPTGIYLVSPLFTRTELVEAAPAVAGPVATQAPVSTARPSATSTSTSTSTSAKPSATSKTGLATILPTDSPPAAVQAISGRFAGADSFHFGRGVVSVLEPSPGKFVLRFEDFEVQNGPDLFVYVSGDPAGYAAGAAEVARLKATKGSFNVDVPANVDVSGIRSVVIWCKAFGVQFAHAELSPG